ncbi:MAG: sulfite exporter TauE/SafE family protein, partial [Kangiellaceae bacterium]|nr:sulfite exporter TauE/SafE family protein [Kangiellaceae bacterium]
MNLSIFALLGAAAIGLSLGLLGSGGSILTVPVLVYLVGQEEKIAIAGSLFVVGSIAVLGTIPYLRQKLVDWKTVWMFGIPGMAGTYIGAWLSVLLSGVMQLAIFAFVMFAASYFMLKPQKDLKSDHPGERHVIKIVIDGLVVGILTGVVGVGGGFLIVPALVLLGGLSMRVAVASSLMIIALKSYSGFVKYLDVLNEAGKSLDWTVLTIMIALGGAGTLFGNHIAN